MLVLLLLLISASTGAYSTAAFPADADDTAVKTVVAVEVPHIAELQGAAGRLVWVLGQNLAAPCVRLAGLDGKAAVSNGECLLIEARVNDSLLLVDLGSPPTGMPLVHRLLVETAVGQALSPPLNAPELHYVDPYARPGDTVAVVGRRFVDPHPSVVLSCGGSPNVTVSAFVESDTRATFVLPADTAVSRPGRTRCIVAWSDSSGLWYGATSGGPAAATALQVLAPLPSGETNVDASKPPYSANPTGNVDATDAILGAIAAAPEGGTVQLPAGTFRLNPPQNRTAFPQSGACQQMTAAICTGPKRVTIIGAGQGKTTLLLGNRALVGFWGSAISLRHLTMSDELPASCYNATNKQVEQKCMNATLRYNSPALWSMNTWGAWTHNVSDVSFADVHFVSSRSPSALHLRYCRRCTVQNCLMDGGSIEVAGPLQDVRILNITARLHGPDPKELGGGVGAFVMGGVGGRISGLLVANNTLGALYPIEQSTISGRIVILQGNAEHLYVANNLNQRAGPGDQCPDMNQGEQVLWESGVESLASARALDDTNASVLNVDGKHLKVRCGFATTKPYILAKVLAAGSLPVAQDPTGGMLARGWDSEYAHVGAARFGGVTILHGAGAGQTRMILGVTQPVDPDEFTLQLMLDREWGVPPDAKSDIVVWGSCVHSIVMRDNIFHGIPKHVDQVAHTATVMIPIWGRAHRATYTNNIGNDMRTTMYSMVDGRATTGTSLTTTDHIIRDVVSTHTRVGLDIVPQPHNDRLTMIVTMLNITLRNTVEAAVGLSPSASESDPNSGTCGGLAIDGLLVENASIGLASYRPGANPASPWLKFKADWNGTGIGALLIRNAHFAGPGGEGSLLTQPLPHARFSHVDFTGFTVASNGTTQPAIPYVLTPLVTSTIAEWTVLVENGGLTDAMFTLTHLDTKLKAEATKWALKAASGPTRVKLSGGDGGGCGVISGGGTEAHFCCRQA